MRWPGRSSDASGKDGHKDEPSRNETSPDNNGSTPISGGTSGAGVNSSNKRPISWNDSLNKTDWQHYKDPTNWVPTILVTVTALAGLRFYKSYLRRIPGTGHIRPAYFRKRSLFGRVTSVGDGDGFHLFHTPGGRWVGWGWLRRVPAKRSELKGHTIPIRIAGIDAPEGAHFGRPAQPFAAESLQYLTQRILHRPVRAYIHRRDQYERVVATVYVRRRGLAGWLPLPLPRSWRGADVGLELLRRGLATMYEARAGAEFGGLEVKYRAAEEAARRRKKGMWALSGTEGFETPREYKTKWADAEKKGGQGGGTAAAAETGEKDGIQLTGSSGLGSRLWTWLRGKS